MPQASWLFFFMKACKNFRVIFPTNGWAIPHLKMNKIFATSFEYYRWTFLEMILDFFQITRHALHNGPISIFLPRILNQSNRSNKIIVPLNKAASQPRFVSTNSNSNFSCSKGKKRKESLELTTSTIIHLPSIKWNTVNRRDSIAKREISTGY